MKYLCLFICLFICLHIPFAATSQRLHGDFYGGIANYQGDLQGKRFTFKSAGPAFGLGLSYDITDKFIVRGIATYLKIGGDDKNNSTATGVTFRNLNFKSQVLEAQLALEYNFFDLSERNFTPYVFGGVAAFHFQPYSYDAKGNKVLLRPLSTEGEGLSAYPDKKTYNTKQIAIPFGGGLKFVLSDKVQVGIELGLRKLFTDYLDDVSTTYADSSILLAARGPQAVAFAYRGNELKGAPPYPAAGSQRGNPKSKDWYYTTVIRISYLFGGGSSNGRRGGGKSRTGCPANVN
ncbi:MAG: DUF6089 family protein [Ferruginibacter sp.]